MKRFLWEISLGIPLIIILFSVITLLLMNLDVLGVIEQVPVKEIGVFEWSVVVVFIIVQFSIMMIILGITIFIWSKIVSRFLNKESRSEIIHGFLRTPGYGWAYRFNTRYVNWVIENS